MAGLDVGVGTQVGVEVIRKQNPVWIGAVILVVFLIICVLYKLYDKGWF